MLSLSTAKLILTGRAIEALTTCHDDDAFRQTAVILRHDAARESLKRLMLCRRAHTASPQLSAGGGFCMPAPTSQDADIALAAGEAAGFSAINRASPSRTAGPSEMAAQAVTAPRALSKISDDDARGLRPFYLPTGFRQA